jgi:hypothetical protein
MVMSYHAVPYGRGRNAQFAVIRRMRGRPDAVVASGFRTLAGAVNAAADLNAGPSPECSR